MREWKETNLYEIIDLIGGGTPKTSVPEYWNGDFPWLSVADFNNGKKYVFETEKTITEVGLKNSSTKLLNKGDIIISARGTVGVVAVLGKEMTFNQSCYGIRAKSDLSTTDYVYYLLKDTISGFLQIAHGGVFDTITRDTFKEIEIKLPPLPEQTAIASVLSSLDDKIDLLHRQNVTLEKMAETLFRQWFVERRPEPADGEAKEEWEVIKLGSIIEIINGVSYKSDDLNPSKTAMVTLKSFDRNGGFRLDGFKEYIGKYKEQHILKEGDLVVAHTDITQDADVIGNPAIVIGNPKFETLIFSMDLVKVISKSKNYTNEFLYLLMKNREFKEHCLGYSNGSTVLHLSKKAIPEFEMKLPPESLINEFSRKVKPLIQKQLRNQNQIRTLTTLRDTLLPKLMSGEVRVKEMQGAKK